jgi:uncharacterized membrane protein
MNRNHRALRAIGLLALAGMLVAAYDFISRILGIPLFCPFAGNGCDIVQNSPYAAVFGIPLAFLGTLGFGAYIVLAYLGGRSGPDTRWYLYALLALNLLTVCAMAYFSYLELAVIHAVCSLCMFSAALNIALGIVIVYAMRLAPTAD